MDIAMTQRILRAALMTPGLNGRWGLTLNFIGDPGVGKTTVIREVVKSLGMGYEVLALGVREPVDLLGYGVPTEDGYLRYHVPDFVKRARSSPASILHVDEMNHAAPATLGAAQRTILEGVVGDVSLGNHTRFICSMNSFDQAMSAGGSALNVALANRMGHLPWPSPAVWGWASWLMGHEKDPLPQEHAADVERRVMKKWPQAWAKARSLLTGFMYRRPDLLCKTPELHSPAASGAHPSPRSWELFARALAGGAVHDLTDTEISLLAGSFVGTETSAEYEAWSHNADLPNPLDVLNGDVKFEHDPRRLDRSLAVFNALSSYVKEEGDTKRRAEWLPRVWEMLLPVAKSSPDILVGAVQELMKVCRSTAWGPQAIDVLASMQPVFQATAGTR